MLHIIRQVAVFSFNFFIIIIICYYHFYVGTQTDTCKDFSVLYYRVILEGQTSSTCCLHFLHYTYKFHTIHDLHYIISNEETCFRDFPIILKCASVNLLIN